MFARGGGTDLAGNILNLEKSSRSAVGPDDIETVKGISINNVQIWLRTLLIVCAADMRDVRMRLCVSTLCLFLISMIRKSDYACGDIIDCSAFAGNDFKVTL